MKTKSFQNYLEKRLSQQEISAIKEQAALEVKFLQSIQKMLADTLTAYMKKNNIGADEVAKQLHWSKAKITKIQKGEAHLTLANLAHFFALLGKEPQDIFKKAK